MIEKRDREVSFLITQKESAFVTFGEKRPNFRKVKEVVRKYTTFVKIHCFKHKSRRKVDEKSCK